MRTVPDPILIFPAIFFLSFSQDPMPPANNPKIMRNIIAIEANIKSVSDSIFPLIVKMSSAKRTGFVDT